MGRPKLATVCLTNDQECSSGRIKRGYCVLHYRRVRYRELHADGDVSTEPVPSPYWRRCAWCADRFQTAQSKRRFCSVLCRDQERHWCSPKRQAYEAVRVRTRKPYEPRPGVTVDCNECGRTVTGAHPNRDYCSQACARRVAERTRGPRYGFRKGRRMMLTPEQRVELRAYERLLRRDPCAYCGRSMEHLDHIEPVALGGPDTWDNFTAACSMCNVAKGAQRLLPFLLAKVG